MAGRQIQAKAEEAQAAAAARALRTSTASSNPAGDTPRNEETKL